MLLAQDLADFTGKLMNCAREWVRKRRRSSINYGQLLRRAAGKSIDEKIIKKSGKIGRLLPLCL